MREKTIERLLVRGVRGLGGEIFKLRWIGHNGAPDRVVFWRTGKVEWIELKAPGKKPTALQELVHTRMARYGQRVRVFSTPEQVAEYLREMQFEHYYDAGFKAATR